jgi:hypothetical protein
MYVLLVSGLKRGRGHFENFFGAPMIYFAKSIFAVNASSRWLNKGYKFHPFSLFSLSYFYFCYSVVLCTLLRGFKCEMKISPSIDYEMDSKRRILFTIFSLFCWWRHLHLILLLDFPVSLFGLCLCQSILKAQRRAHYRGAIAE